MFETISKVYGILDARDKRAAVCLLIVFVVMAGLEVFGVGAIFWFLSAVMDPSKMNDIPFLATVRRGTGIETDSAFLFFLGGCLFLAILARNMFAAVTVYAQERFMLGRNYRLSLRLLDNYVRLPYLKIVRENSADLTKRVLNDIWRISTGIIFPIVDSVSKAIVAGALIAFLLWTNWILTLTVMGTMVVIAALVIMPLKRRLRSIGNDLISTDASRFTSLSEIFSGSKDIRVFGCERFFRDRYARAAFRHRSLVLNYKVIAQLPHFSLETLAVAIILGVVFFVQMTTGDAAAVITTATLYAVAGYRMLPAVKSIAQSINEIELSTPTLKALEADLGLSSSLDDTPDDSERIVFNDRLSIRNVSFSFGDNDRPTLSGIDIDIPRNSSVAFVGPTGAGKTTLMDIVLGLITPESGGVLIDGARIDSGNLRPWQKTIGYVPQHIFLTDSTIRENIAFGLEPSDIDDEAVRRAARLASIAEFVEDTLPEGYDTVVGERGVRLSGGERQRIGIARALYHRPSVLVLDEATSSLDGRTEAVISGAIATLAQEMTLIVIAHRLSTVKDCDTIYLMEKGRIVDSGTYDGLLASSDTFRAMARA